MFYGFSIKEDHFPLSCMDEYEWLKVAQRVECKDKNTEVQVKETLLLPSLQGLIVIGLVDRIEEWSESIV